MNPLRDLPKAPPALLAAALLLPSFTPAKARAGERDGPEAPPLPSASLEITRPKAGEQFPPSRRLELEAVAVDPLGTIYQVEFWADEEQIGVSVINTLVPPDPGEPMVHSVQWPDPPTGVHVLTARALDSAGTKVVSPPIRILVGGLPTPFFVERELPQTYTPAEAFEVRLVATPPQVGAAWAVAERPPRGWSVSELSDEGAWDAVQGLVKFGPYTDLTARTLTYRVTAPPEARGPQGFSGEAALDGQVTPIRGDRAVEPLNQNHPADRDPADFSIGLSEVTAYAAAWKEGGSWPSGPVPIPMDYVTRAGQLWKQGERYRYDPALGAPPECWIPVGDTEPDRPQRVGGQNAERSVAGAANPGSSVEVVLTVTPGEWVGAYAVEEILPARWAFAEADGDAGFDAAHRRLRWGPFYDAQPRRLTYRLTAPPGTASLGVLHGEVSFDGRRQRILGTRAVVATDDDTAIRFRGMRREGHALRLEIAARPGQVCDLETSTDLLEWARHSRVFVSEAGVVEIEESSRPGPARYFRVRPSGDDE